ncbi:outer membrane protein assembly factor BamB family protein [Kribbella monticola]|uniref:outer membrane protein assembly factor BamB family protein n=1 Tax=Kribbella monticola TaxID=2185285 RepID=UPI001E3EF441|nr:PQQ-binding-like beta-propeller repeat protein [Kribbella monticola]
MPLRDRWNDVIPDAATLADDLVARYTASDRKAYRPQYLEAVLAALDSLEQLSTDPVAVRLAVWFHRAVHKPSGQPAEDAEASAEFAEDSLPAYGVSSARVAEVARLVRLTGASSPAAQDANAQVLLDAVNASYAATNYATHASELRRDAWDGSDAEGASDAWDGSDAEGARDAGDASDARDAGDAGDRSTAIKQRLTAVRELLDGPIYRTQLGRERFDSMARANLTRELAVLDGALPAPWRGWQRAALIAAAVFSPLLAAMAAYGAAHSSWRSPSSSDSAWFPGVLCVLELCTVPLFIRFAPRVGRTARVVSGAVVVAGLAALITTWVLVPAKTPSTGVGDRVPLLMISAVLLLVAGLAALASCWPVARHPRPEFNRGQLLSVVTTLAVIVGGVVFVAEPIHRAYLLGANEHLTGSDAPVGIPARSELTGGIAWVSRPISYSADAVRRSVSTKHGIAIASETGTVVMLDPATGEQRWRYSRSDSDGTPELAATADGQLLIANFDDVGYLVLDAATGKRQAWPSGTRDHDLLSADPLLTGEQVGKGSDKLRGVDLDGNDRWTFEPGRCTTIDAIATADTALALLDRQCGERHNETTALDLKTGKKLWSRPSPWFGEQPMAVGGLIVWTERDGRSEGEMRGTLVGVEPRTGTVKWRWEVPSNWACGTRVTVAGDKLVLLDCPVAAKDTQTVVTVLNAATGGSSGSGLPRSKRVSGSPSRPMPEWRWSRTWRRRTTVCWT